MLHRQLNLTLKKSLYPTQKWTDRVQLARFEYWQRVRQIPAKDLVFLDESGVNLAFVRDYARSEKGHKTGLIRLVYPLLLLHRRGLGIAI